MSKFGSRRGAADSLTMILMVVAFVAMAGLMYWLSQNAEPTSIEVPDEEPEVRIEIVAAVDFGSDPLSYAGREFRLPGVEVASRLGDQAFWVQIPVQAPDGTMLTTPFLVKMDSATATGIRVRSGETVAIEGTVVQMNDSILNAWEAAGAINSGNRIEAEFASEFFQATKVDLSSSGGSGGGSPGAPSADR